MTCRWQYGATLHVLRALGDALWLDLALACGDLATVIIITFISLLAMHTFSSLPSSGITSHALQIRLVQVPLLSAVSTNKHIVATSTYRLAMPAKAVFLKLSSTGCSKHELACRRATLVSCQNSAVKQLAVRQCHVSTQELMVETVTHNS